MNKILFTGAVALCLVTVGGFAGPAGAQGVGTAPVPTPQPAAVGSPVSDLPADYRIDTDDTISIGVTRHNEVGGTFKIPPDGLIRLSRLNSPISVRGKTTAELVSDITDRLTHEGKLVLRPGQVTVTLVSARSRRVYVRGSAVRGGEFDLKNGWRVADLAAVMGTVPQPDRVKARLTSAQRPAPIDIDLKAALDNPQGPSNVLLQEGDTLTVEQPAKKRLLITGEAPRGEVEVEEWVGLKRALLAKGFTAAAGGAGDLAGARLIRHADPQDLSSPSTIIPVDLQQLLNDENAPEVQFKDMDTLDVPLSDKFVWVMGEVGGPPRKYYLPQDRKTYLLDIFQSTGSVPGNAAIGRITVMRHTVKSGDITKEDSWERKEYDLGKFYKTGEKKYNPEIKPQDMVYVPTNNRRDPVANIWTAFGLYNLVKVFVPSIGR